MITSFDDFCEFWRQVAPAMRRPGPQPLCSDSELVTMAVIGATRGWDKETELRSYWRERHDLLPVVPARTRFNRRRRALMLGINLVRQYVLQALDLAYDPHAASDSLPSKFTS